MEDIKQLIVKKNTTLGIELGSTRIKAVLIDKCGNVLASGAFDWENSLVNGVWTYPLSEAVKGVQSAFAKLKADVYKKYGVKLTSAGAMGISGMMHGYLPFDKDGVQICEFRTWRNTITAESAQILSEKFNFNIPQRWSVAHLYQAMLNKEEHVKNIDFICTLSVYIHRLLTGEKVIGIGEASGMFPIDSETNDYSEKMLGIFDSSLSVLDRPLRSILPKVLCAGDSAGTLTEEGALLLDPTGEFESGIPMCPPEGDAGTGMVATDSVAKRTGNISAGTSIFLMAVLEKPLSKLYPEIDIVTTPDGSPVAMVHCNNCCGEIDAWANLFASLCEKMGLDVSVYKVLDKIFECALSGDKDCGGLVGYNYISGEVITGLDTGKPLFFRQPDSAFTFENFARMLLCSAVATLSIGMDILKGENVKIDSLTGHGGYFKAPTAGQKIMSAALEAPVSVMKTAGEGGPWGMAILAGYMLNKKGGESLGDYLKENIFSDNSAFEVMSDENDRAGFKAFLDSYRKGLAAEKAAVG
ncbi:MAG: ATPase [Clostridiales bacterium]|nr:ATPase [Clostridiales bacterium]